jgi:TonB family protein
MKEDLKIMVLTTLLILTTVVIGTEAHARIAKRSITEGTRVLNEGVMKGNLEYPNDLRRMGIEGIVTVKVLISRTGEVKDYEIIRCDDVRLQGIVRKNIFQFKFSPAVDKLGYPIERWAYLPIRFTLN